MEDEHAPVAQLWLLESDPTQSEDDACVAKPPNAFPTLLMMFPAEDRVSHVIVALAAGSKRELIVVK